MKLTSAVNAEDMKHSPFTRHLAHSVGQCTTLKWVELQQTILRPKGCDAFNVLSTVFEPNMRSTNFGSL